VENNIFPEKVLNLCMTKAKKEQSEALKKSLAGAGGLVEASGEKGGLKRHDTGGNRKFKIITGEGRLETA
jgi:hypothetical protein